MNIQAKRGCPVCVRGWRLIAAASAAALLVALVMLAWHATGQTPTVESLEVEPPAES